MQQTTKVCREHVELELYLREFPPSQPGQFLQLACGEKQAESPAVRDWPAGEFPRLEHPSWHERTAYLRRPFSIADRRDTTEGVLLYVISRTIGRGTHWLEHLRAGDALNLTGPLGTGFDLSPREGPLVLLGGGVGIPPLLYAARQLLAAGRTDFVALFGATTAELVPLRLTKAPAADGTPRECVGLADGMVIPAIIATDDGTCGVRGRVTDAFEAWYESNAGRVARPTVLACGPDAMLRATAGITRHLGTLCQLCIERNMGCGLSACLSCVVRVRDESRASGWRWALACAEGPVFERDVLVDYAGADVHPPAEPGSCVT